MELLDSDARDRWWHGCRICGSTHDDRWLVDDDPWSAVHVHCVERILGTLNAAVIEAVRINDEVEREAVDPEDIERVRTDLRTAIQETRTELELAEMMLEQLPRLEEL